MKDTIQIQNPNQPDIRFQDGALPHMVGVKSYQILRANREHPELAEGTGWTYNHAAMLAYYHGKLYCEYLSNPVSEHEAPGRTWLVSSENGQDWSKPLMIFPEITVSLESYKGPRGADFPSEVQTVMHQRMGFYQAKNDVLLVLGFHGIVHDRYISSPCDGWGVGRVVRRIFADGRLGEIHFLKFNEVAGFTKDNVDAYSFYTSSEDAEFQAACEELLQNRPVIQQMYEEQRHDKAFIPTEGRQALSYYTIEETGEMVGVHKQGATFTSNDRGKSFSDITLNPTLITSTGKVWAQRTSKGQYTLMYNPTKDGQHRWPIAAVTSTNGHHFAGMAAITDFMSPQRYGGLDKNFGPQYMRGICEANMQTPDGDIWLVYSNNKEDIWISHIPVPLTSVETMRVNENFADAPDGELPRLWRVYSPQWAKVSMENGALTLRDSDFYDRASAERAIMRSASGKSHVSFAISELQEECTFAIEWQDDQGRVPMSVRFNADGKVYVNNGGRFDAMATWTQGDKLSVDAAWDCSQSVCTYQIGDQTYKVSFANTVQDITRINFATKPLSAMHLNTLEDNGKYGVKEQKLPNAGERLAQSVVSIFDFSAE